MESNCQWCGVRLRRSGVGRPQRFCSSRCRVAAHRANRLPVELTSRDRWVRRSAKKVPLTVSGKAASSTDPSTWSSYSAAAKSTVGVGLGYVLHQADGVVALDLDRALVDGRPVPWAQALLDDLPPTYVQVSQSGSGLHVFGRGSLPVGRVIRDGRCIEAYSSGRYIAMTGVRFGDSPLTLAELPLSVLLAAVA